jgi:hypothetical protein
VAGQPRLGLGYGMLRIHQREVGPLDIRVAARIAVLAALCSVALGQAIAQDAPEPRPLRNGLEALLSCAELDSLQRAISGSFPGAGLCASWIDAARQKYCPESVAREAVLGRFLAGAPDIRRIAHLLSPEDIIRGVLRTVLECRQSDEIREAPWPPRFSHQYIHAKMRCQSQELAELL